MHSAQAHTTDPREQLRHVLQHAAHLLPMQGPIGVFIHHNTLHAFQHLPFEEAVLEAAELFGTEPYMREQQYRDEFQRGRILLEDLDSVLSREPNCHVFAHLDRRLLRRLMLVPGGRPLHRSTIRWEMEEGGLLKSEEDRKLFAACLQVSEAVPIPLERSGSRLRDVVLEATGDDLDDIVHPLLIRICGAYLDQGLAYWPMPERELGFYAAVRSLWKQPGAVLPTHLGSLTVEFERQARAELTAEDSVIESLSRLRVDSADWERFIVGELLALPGWAGLMSRLEHEPRACAS